MDFRRQPAAVPARIHQPIHQFLGLVIHRLCHELVVSVAMMLGMAWFFRVSNRTRCAPPPSTSRSRSHSAFPSKAYSRWRGDLGDGVGSRGVVRPSSMGVVGPVGLRHQGVSGGDPGRPRSDWRAVLGGIIIGLLENIAHIDSEYLHWGTCTIAPFYVLIIILMIKAARPVRHQATSSGCNSLWQAPLSFPPATTAPPTQRTPRSFRPRPAAMPRLPLASCRTCFAPLVLSAYYLP